MVHTVVRRIIVCCWAYLDRAVGSGVGTLWPFSFGVGGKNYATIFCAASQPCTNWQHISDFAQKLMSWQNQLRSCLVVVANCRSMKVAVRSSPHCVVLDIYLLLHFKDSKSEGYRYDTAQQKWQQEAQRLQWEILEVHLAFWVYSVLDQCTAFLLCSFRCLLLPVYIYSASISIIYSAKSLSAWSVGSVCNVYFTMCVSGSACQLLCIWVYFHINCGLRSIPSSLCVELAMTIDTLLCNNGNFYIIFCMYFKDSPHNVLVDLQNTIHFLPGIVMYAYLELISVIWLL